MEKTLHVSRGGNCAVSDMDSFVSGQNPLFPEVVRCCVQGLKVDAVDMAQTLSIASQAVRGGRQMRIYAVNPEKVIKSENDIPLTQLMNGCECLIPDGIGVVWAMRLLGQPCQRVPGSELMPKLCEVAAEHGWPVYLLGASASVNNETAARLRQRYPNLVIAGARDGYFSDDQSPLIVDEINRSGAIILFVAMGSPKQEVWMAEHRADLRVNVMQGVGGTFDVIAGSVKRAPPVWLKLNLEWLYRLLREPKRLLRQRALPKFAWRLLRSYCFSRSAP